MIAKSKFTENTVTAFDNVWHDAKQTARQWFAPVLVAASSVGFQSCAPDDVTPGNKIETPAPKPVEPKLTDGVAYVYLNKNDPESVLSLAYDTKNFNGQSALTYGQTVSSKSAYSGNIVKIAPNQALDPRNQLAVNFNLYEGAVSETPATSSKTAFFTAARDSVVIASVTPKDPTKDFGNSNGKRVVELRYVAVNAGFEISTNVNPEFSGKLARIFKTNFSIKNVNEQAEATYNAPDNFSEWPFQHGNVATLPCVAITAAAREPK